MKTPIPLTLLLAAVTLGQEELFPTCSGDCFAPVIERLGCVDSDWKLDMPCACSYGAWILEITKGCIKAKCSAADATNVVNTAKAVCEKLGIPIESSSEEISPREIGHPHRRDVDKRAPSEYDSGASVDCDPPSSVPISFLPPPPTTQTGSPTPSLVIIPPTPTLLTPLSSVIQVSTSGTAPCSYTTLTVTSTIRLTSTVVPHPASSVQPTTYLLSSALTTLKTPLPVSTQTPSPISQSSPASTFSASPTTKSSPPVFTGAADVVNVPAAVAGVMGMAAVLW